MTQLPLLSVLATMTSGRTLAVHRFGSSAALAAPRNPLHLLFPATAPL